MLLTPVSEQQLDKEAKEAEVSSHPFNPATSLFTSSHAFPLLAVLISHPLVSLPYQSAAFQRGLCLAMLCMAQPPC